MLKPFNSLPRNPLLKKQAVLLKKGKFTSVKTYYKVYLSKTRLALHHLCIPKAVVDK